MLNGPSCSKCDWSQLMESPGLYCKQQHPPHEHMTCPMLPQQGYAEDSAAWGSGCLAPKTLFLALTEFPPLCFLPARSAQLGTDF